jgi:hypothetical protein
MRGCLPTWRDEGWPTRGNAGTGKKGQATRGESEQEVEAALCTAAAGEKELQRRQEQSRGTGGFRGRR